MSRNSNSFLQDERDCFSLRKVDSYKYLGCIIHKDLKFDLDIQRIHKFINKYRNDLNICTVLLRTQNISVFCIC